jgi:hypothetical protein
VSPPSWSNVAKTGPREGSTFCFFNGGTTSSGS